MISLFEFSAIAFPNIDPVLLRLGPLQVHWYGIAYVVGILFSWWYTRKLVTTNSLWGNRLPKITSDHLDDFLTWAVVGIILGGRLGYILFYDFGEFAQNPLRIFEIWKGGMSFHGGLLGVLLAMILFARKHGFSPFNLFDIITAAAPVGIFCVRLTNFINGELFGKPTDLPWAIAFPNGGPVPRHPSQLYEAALEGLVMFLILWLLTYQWKKLRQPGFIAGAFILWYATSRILIEFVRLPDAQIGYLFGNWLTMGMVLSIPLALTGIWAISTSTRRANSKP